MNKVILKGRLTADPELKTTQSGVSVCSFALAVNHRFNKNETDFINCQAWRQSAEFISKYFRKGQEMLVEGELNIEKWENAVGQKHSAPRVVVDRVEFCGGKSDSDTSKSSPAKAPAAGDYDSIVDDDSLPFF